AEAQVHERPQNHDAESHRARDGDVGGAGLQESAEQDRPRPPSPAPVSGDRRTPGEWGKAVLRGREGAAAFGGAGVVRLHPPGALGLRARSDDLFILSQTAPCTEINHETVRPLRALAAPADADTAAGLTATRSATPPGTTRRPDGARRLHRDECRGADRGRQ